MYFLNIMILVNVVKSVNVAVLFVLSSFKMLHIDTRNVHWSGYKF